MMLWGELERGNCVGGGDERHRHLLRSCRLEPQWEGERTVSFGFGGRFVSRASQCCRTLSWLVFVALVSKIWSSWSHLRFSASLLLRLIGSNSYTTKPEQMKTWECKLQVECEDPWNVGFVKPPLWIALRSSPKHKSWEQMKIFYGCDLSFFSSKRCWIFQLNFLLSCCLLQLQVTRRWFHNSQNFVGELKASTWNFSLLFIISPSPALDVVRSKCFINSRNLLPLPSSSDKPLSSHNKNRRTFPYLTFPFASESNSAKLDEIFKLRKIFFQAQILTRALKRFAKATTEGKQQFITVEIG